MRRTALLIILPVLAAAPLAAQFTGTVHMKMAIADNAQLSEITVVLKGSKSAYTMPTPMIPGSDMHMIIDAETQKVMIFTPLSPDMAGMVAQMPGMAGAKGIIMTTDMNAAANQATKGAAPTFKNLGTTETIAGMRCEDWQATDGKSVTNMCMSKELGKFMFSGTGGRGGRGGGTPAWTRILPPDAGYPLKVWTADGKVSQEVTSVQKGVAPESAFVVPEGYVAMPGMGGMRGGGI